MKKLIATAVMFLMVCAVSLPAFADGAASANDGQDQVKNVRVGAQNASTGWVEVLDSTHAEASKGKSSGEQITGVMAGGAIGVRKAIHRTGAGIIDLLTFWIPKKQPLLKPEKARLQ